MAQYDALAEKFKALEPVLNELARRRWAATEALAIGRGGISAVALATGLSRKTIRAGIREMHGEAPSEAVPAMERLRRAGAGRKRRVERDPTLLRDLEALVESTTRGDPQSPLRWTCKSVRRLATELQAQGHRVSPQLVSELLRGADYSLQGTRKTRKEAGTRIATASSGTSTLVRSFQRRGQPVVSVDTKKKEIIGNYKNPGREWEPKGRPRRVKSKDFPDKELGKVAPYGVYDLTADEGWVNVGISHDTAEFAVESVKRWWCRMGRRAYPEATELLITADSGGSNGPRNRLWKVCLQELADETGLRIAVCHFPPGTSKWNRIEHRMFCHITENWRGRPLVSRAVVVNLIGSTRTKTGLRVRAELDTNRYEQGIKVTDDEMQSVRLERDKFHGDWNYTILSHQQCKAARRANA